MNLFQNILGVARRGFATIIMLALILGVAPLAKAQSGFDLFGATRVLTWNPINMTNHSGTLNASNAPIDIHGYAGVGMVLFSVTNYAGNAGSPTIYARLLGSTDNTNWFLMTNTSFATLTTYNVTNRSGGTVETNQYALPGTITTPTAATAGFASSYLVPQPYTNFAILCTNVAFTNAAIVAWDLQDGPRYVQIAYTVTGTDVAFAPVAFFIGRRTSDYFY